jgi:sensor histidine kinase YesM
VFAAEKKYVVTYLADDRCRIPGVQTIDHQIRRIGHSNGGIRQQHFQTVERIPNFAGRSMQEKRAMTAINDKSIYTFFGGKVYFFVAASLGLPIFVAVKYYAESIHVAEDELVSFAATVCFLLGVFSGRYISQVWASRLTVVPPVVLVGLPFIIVCCTAWLFFHADFPLKDRVAINLMLFWLPFAVISVATGILVKLIHTSTQNQLKEAQNDAAHSKSELNLLHSQLSPHFLFNTLNNLYGLSISDHEKIPALLLKLSELLRYSVYDAGEPYVPLKNELAYIYNYLQFEQLRIGDRLMLTTDIEEQLSDEVKIAPMLLIIFIENAFKHSKNSATPEIFVDIKLKTWGSSILFAIRNTYGKEEQSNNRMTKHNGFGLPNVRKRLELLYPNAHDLYVHSDEMFYNVELQLKIR